MIFPDVDAGHRSDLRLAIQAMPAAKHLSIRVRGFDPAGISVVEMQIAPELTFDGTVVQGGVVGVLADFAGVSAAACTLPSGWLASTTSFEIQNLAPASGVQLVAVGRSISVRRTWAVSRADVYAMQAGRDAPVLVAIGTTTCRPFERV